ncbi:glycosyltransferase, partial [Enterobacter sp. Bisph1]|uniref:glycosyltransferase n=1 Tax=Enterobacter sp. Bisph1 TaxID=1274399 RepID=UPI00057BEC41
MGFYFSRFETRRPPEPLSTPGWVKKAWQILAVAALILGANYIRWRWMESLNMDALWYAIPLVVAETLAWIGTALFTINLWQEKDVPQQSPPADINQCLHPDDAVDPRPLKVDLFIATYSEDVELVRLSIRDALKIAYPWPLDYRIHVLDDGRRPEMKAVCDEEGVNYITRQNNIGYKAGNLRNGLEQTDGDFLVICDADTRVFPTLLSHTLGYFRDPDVAWVQTPQWFYDLPEGERLPRWLKRKTGKAGYALGWTIEKACGPVTIGRDPFFNDPRMFYDVILRRRNWANAAFCCGAASIHRRE